MFSIYDFFSRNIQFLPAKPLVWFRLLKNYGYVFMQKPRLRVVTIALGYDCQCHCQHCSADTRSKTQTALTLVAKVFQDAMRCGAINIHFSGGEPLLYENLYELAAVVSPKLNILSLATNGLLLEQQAIKLKNAGFDLVIVSIDSSNPAEHDSIRGVQGAHKQAWKGIFAARQAGLKVMAAMVVTRENLRNGDLAAQIKYCQNLKLALQLLPARAMGKWNERKDVLFNQEDKELFFRFVLMPGVRWDGQSSYGSVKCLAGRERLYIDPAGNVYGCDFMRKKLGNINDNSLNEIWQDVIRLAPFNRVNKECLTAFDKAFIG
ncbi:MAG: radical SAM protein [Candidatus Omnitrophota bacterium]